MSLATTCMDLKGIMLSKIVQTQKEKYLQVLLVCGIYKKGKNIKITVCSDYQGHSEWEEMGKMQIKRYRVTR